MIRYLRTLFLFTWAGLHRYFGIQNSMKSEFARAVHYYGRVLTLDPGFHNARLQRGILLTRELGRHDEALSDFNALLEHDDYRGEALLNRALTYQEQARFAAALADLEAYIDLPQQGDSYREAVRMTAVLREILAESDDA